MGEAAGCTTVLGAAQPGTVKVSSARFPESIVLSYMALESLEANTDLVALDGGLALIERRLGSEAGSARIAAVG